MQESLHSMTRSATVLRLASPILAARVTSKPRRMMLMMTKLRIWVTHLSKIENQDAGGVDLGVSVLATL